MVSRGIVILIFLKCCVIVALANKELPCRLEWSNANLGGKLPDNLIQIHGESQYAARGTDNDGQYIIGSYDTTSNIATFPFASSENSTATILFEFQLLTNPHNCTVGMPQLKNGQVPNKFNVETGRENIYVGRAFIDDVWLAGSVNTSQNGIMVAVDGETTLVPDYQVLTSYSGGLYLAVTEFEFVREPFGGKLNYVGVEKLSNNAQTTIVQKIEHSSKITEVSTIKTFRDSTSDRTEKSGIDFYVYGKETKAEHTYVETVEEEFTTIKETELNLLYEVRVPPFQTVIACTTINVIKNISEPFRAKGVYKAPSLTPVEIQNILRESGVHTSTIVGDEVVVPMTGNFKGTIAMSSKMVALPLDEGNTSEDCFGRQEQLFAQSQERKLKLRLSMDGNKQ